MGVVVPPRLKATHSRALQTTEQVRSFTLRLGIKLDPIWSSFHNTCSPLAPPQSTVWETRFARDLTSTWKTMNSVNVILSKTHASLVFPIDFLHDDNNVDGWTSINSFFMSFSSSISICSFNFNFVKFNSIVLETIGVVYNRKEDSILRIGYILKNRQYADRKITHHARSISFLCPPFGGIRRILCTSGGTQNYHHY